VVIEGFDVLHGVSSSMKEVLAETRGFEPPRGFKSPTSLAVRE